MDFLEIDFNILKTEIHQTAKEKGWWDKPRNVGEILMLVISELAEALEAKRQGKEAHTDIFAKWTGSDFEKNPNYFKGIFKQFVKDTVADELADAVIRLLDYAGFANLNIDVKKHSDRYNLNDNFGETLRDITIGVCIIDDYSVIIDKEDSISISIFDTCRLAEKEGIDIHRHILLKMLYNKNRERMHGKKF